MRAGPRSFEDSDTHTLCLCSAASGHEREVNRWMKLWSQPGSSWTGISVGRLADGTPAFALTIRMGILGITAISHWCDTETCIFQLKFPSMTNLCLFRTAYLRAFFNPSQNRAPKKTVLGNTQTARWLKSSQASYFALPVSGCLDPILFFHTLVVSAQVKLSGQPYNCPDSVSPFSSRASLPNAACALRDTFVELLSPSVTLRGSRHTVTGINKNISKHIYTAKKRVKLPTMFSYMALENRYQHFLFHFYKRRKINVL